MTLTQAQDRFVARLERDAEDSETCVIASTIVPARRPIREVEEREIAMAVVLELASSGLREFSLMGFYDEDAEFLSDLAARLSVAEDKAFHAKLTRVVRRLVNYSVLYRSMRGTNKEYIDEPAKQMNYGFVNPGKYRLLTDGPTEHIRTPEWEAGFLLRHAYPDPALE